MALKMKAAPAAGSSGVGLTVLVRASDRVDAGGGGGQSHLHHSGAISQASGVVCSRNNHPRGDEKLSHTKP